MANERGVRSLLNIRVRDIRANLSNFSLGLSLGVGFLALFFIFAVYTLGVGLNSLFGGLGEFFGGIGHFFRSVGDLLLAFIEALTILAYALAPVAEALAGLVGVLSAGGEALKDFFKWLNPFD